ncbi:XRE family transcriptional regulator [Rhodanobacter glycinis]|uniref:XRE family transcriptional regulator n=1 Tax=Rhodanobacter glycinis TaxID=582702 RepID=A0A502C6G7_9GAMM|nr:XRE family transcriptional regulator [Rhodanobacter glycinis]
MSHSPIGALLREWRAARHLSQLDLALETGISTRHLSCVETGKARASRDTVSRLADALGMPLRERNALLHAAGFAAMHPERSLAAPALDRVRQAVDLILAHQEPYPAFVISRHWDVLATNAAAARVGQMLMEGRPGRHINLLHQIFDPEDFRPVIANWHEVAARFIRHLHDDLAANPTDRRTQQLLDEMFAYPDVPARWRERELGKEPSPIVTFTFRSKFGELRFFETFTTFAAPYDVTLDELRIDCTFPADDHTAAVCAELAAGEASSSATE